MTDQNSPNSGGRQPAGSGSGAWAPPGPPPPAAPYPSAPPPVPPATPWTAQPPASGLPQPPTQQAWTPPPGGAFNPTPVAGSGYPGGLYRRGGIRGNGIYSMVAGVISLLVALISLAVGHFTFMVFLPILGLVYGIISIRQGNRRAFGIAGTVLCALALLLEAVLLLG